ncbi:hypothetical protein AB0M44_28450 [Streptosporangium subroseum]|uniref:hypothetical protein n=1 Tax=Streptosporangium subroseum TaxID=106412 RepID=UPI00342F7C97
MTDMSIKPGQITTRAEMKEIFGGGPQGGIVPSATTLNVLIYSDPEAGEQSGYKDGWLADEDELVGKGERRPIFEYTGHGEGDQTFEGRGGNGNRAILHHVDDGRLLRVFKAAGTVPGSGTKRQRYIGEFELDDEQPYVMRQAPNKEGVFRRVIVFRMCPNGPFCREKQDEIPPAEKTEVITVPADVTTSAMVEPETSKKASGSRSAIPQTTAERREAKLADSFQMFLEAEKHQVKRFQIKVKGLTSTLLTDLYDATTHVLYEAKGTSSRDAVRMAIGQLMDYCRYVTPVDPTLAVLLPVKPHDDLQDLLKLVNIALVYQDGDDFVGYPV